MELQSAVALPSQILSIEGQFRLTILLAALVRILTKINIVVHPGRVFG